MADLLLCLDPANAVEPFRQSTDREEPMNRRFVRCLAAALMMSIPLLLPGCGEDSVPIDTPRAVVAWNDLGMHCMDNDYSVFAILPPYNNLHAQVVDRATGKAVTSGITVTYEATADTRGSITTSAAARSNFWLYVLSLFGVALPPDAGLAGNRTPGLSPAPLAYDAAKGYWKAEGIPVVCVDDAGNTNYYPMVKVVVRNSRGKVVATTKTVLPVSNEMTCVGCHASNVGGAVDALPAAGWVFDPDPERDWKLNILRIHDDRNFADNALAATYAAALAANGYDPSGLENTVMRLAKPVLCAKCHASNALGTAGAAGVKALTAAMHLHHAPVMQDSTGMPLDAGVDRTACYCCHPGSITQCLRGVMGNALDNQGNALIQCQACHGSMSAVGSSLRRGWLDLPDCGQCHYQSPADGRYVRDNTVFDGTGAIRQATTIFGSPGLYKVSAGHGRIQCEGCHGPTHAEYPSSEANDNLQNAELQGYAGKLVECAVCHLAVPLTKNGGPHGLHTVGSTWALAHAPFAAQDPASCTRCHGGDYRGTFLSKVSTERVFMKRSGVRTVFPAGHAMGCYDCHVTRSW
jgi:hypothetical protein